MKFKILLFIIVFNALPSFSQQTGNLTFYSNTGKKFFVVLNGIRQNIEPETNVNISGLKEAWYSCRIIAEDKSFNIKKNVAAKKDSVITYRILEKRGKYKLRFYSETSLKNTPVVQNQKAIVFQDIALLDDNNSVNDSIEIDMLSDQNSETTEIFSDTTSSNSIMEDGNLYTDDDMIATLDSGGCSIKDEEYNALKSSIENEAFSDDKKQIANEAASKKCMTVEQISQIALLLDFSEERMNFVKAAFLNCLNQKDYIQLASIFTFSTDKKELETFIQSK